MAPGLRPAEHFEQDRGDLLRNAWRNLSELSNKSLSVHSAQLVIALVSERKWELCFPMSRSTVFLNGMNSNSNLDFMGD